MDDEYSFPYANWKSPFLLIPAMIAIYATGMLISKGISQNNSKPIYIASFILFIFILMFGFALSIRIKMNSTGITYSSVFKTLFYKWSEIKTVAGYRQSKFAVVNLSVNELSMPGYLSQKFLFVSIAEKYYVTWGQAPDDCYFAFHYRREMLDLIIEYLKKNANPLGKEIENATSS